MCNLKCAKCNQIKNESEFNKKPKSKTGHHSWCKNCANQNAKDWYQKNKNKENVSERIYGYNKKKKHLLQTAVKNLKSTLGCSLCNEKEPICLDFHHKDGQKDKNISQFVGMKAVKSLINEITKCVCVCSNCHRKIHGKILECPESTLSSEFVAAFFEEFLQKTRTTKTKAKKQKKDRQSDRTNQRKVVWPERALLEKMVWEMPTTHIAKKYGVSDKAIANWCKKYAINKPPLGYWSKKKWAM